MFECLCYLVPNCGSDHGIPLACLWLDGAWFGQWGQADCGRDRGYGGSPLVHHKVFRTRGAGPEGNKEGFIQYHQSLTLKRKARCLESQPRAFSSKRCRLNQCIDFCTGAITNSDFFWYWSSRACSHGKANTTDLFSRRAFKIYWKDRIFVLHRNDRILVGQMVF